MSVEVKPGRWRMRNDEIVVITERVPLCDWPWRGYGVRDRQPTFWSADGRWGPVPGPYDLAEYLGPEEQNAGLTRR